MSSPDATPGELDGRVGLVTGGAQGIGLGIAQSLVDRGAAVAVLDIDEQRAADAAASLRDTGATALAVTADVRDRGAVRRAVAQVTSETGPVDVLVNNAGTVVFKSFVDSTDDDWDNVVGTNLRGGFVVTQEVLRGMLDRRSGAVVNVTSIAAFHYTTQHPLYAAAKAGSVALTRDLAFEVAPMNVRVNAVAPGPVKTPLTERLLSEEDREAYNETIRLGRWGTPADIGEAVAFLVSDRASFITGQTISVAGGADLRVLPGGSTDGSAQHAAAGS